MIYANSITIYLTFAKHPGHCLSNLFESINFCKLTSILIHEKLERILKADLCLIHLIL